MNEYTAKHGHPHGSAPVDIRTHRLSHGRSPGAARSPAVIAAPARGTNPTTAN